MKKFRLPAIILLILSFTGLSIFLFYGNSNEGEEAEKLNEATQAAEYLKYRMASRADANGYVPMDGLIRAKEHIARMPQSRDAGLWEWDWLGPSNIGGRIRAILPDPTNASKLWIGSVAGGIWKSTNSGASWTPVNDFMTNLAITSMVFDPSSTNIMYAATGEGFGNFDGLPGAGIFKSTNGGVTWNQLASTNNDNFKYVPRLAAHPNPDSAGVIYAVTAWSKKLYKTTDGGTSWVAKKTTACTVLDVRVNPLMPNKVIIGCSNDVYLSTDYGETWTLETTGVAGKLPDTAGRCEVTFCPSNSSKIYVSMDRNGGEIWRSIDSGINWSLINTGSNYLGQGWYANSIWVNPANSNQLVVGGVDLWRSTDGGTTLTRISRWQDYHNGGAANSAHADQHIIVQAADYNTTSNPKVYFGNDGGIQKTDNIWTVSQNSGWTNLANTSLGITQFFGGSASNNGSIIIGGTQDNDKLRYKSSGTWSGPNNWFQANTGDGGFAAVNYTNPSILYGEYPPLWISKSTNAGVSYAGATNGLLDAGNGLRALFIAPFSMDPNNPARLVAGGSRIWRTTNDAGIWSQIRADVGSFINSKGETEYYKCSAIDIDFGVSAIIWVGYDNGEVAMTSNTGGFWTRVDNNDGGLPNRYVTDIAINPNNSNQVFVTFGGYNNNNVWYTPDAGVNWENRSGTVPNNLPSLQVNTVRFHPSHFQLGLYRNRPGCVCQPGCGDELECRDKF